MIFEDLFHVSQLKSTRPVMFQWLPLKGIKVNLHFPFQIFCI